MRTKEPEEREDEERLQRQMAIKIEKDRLSVLRRELEQILIMFQ